ncbi:hypothetical protein [Deinococcus aerolatus]|uniref:hypothetical protein n=1 Tax=Deinococcus aerolatus TaxID=522487 RepID=UPI0016694734|nr:hypothetical protein [Deinococcus aerolatus]
MWVKLLLAFIPTSLLLAWVFHAPSLWIFAASVIAIIPLADLLRQGTEQIAARAGQTIGGLLNVTFRNLAELIIAIFVLLLALAFFFVTLRMEGEAAIRLPFAAPSAPASSLPVHARPPRL